MAISFVRIDDRIIHGQVLTQWTRIFPCDGILVVNDYLAANKKLGHVYRNAAPKGIKVFIFSVEKAVTKLVEAKASKKNYYLITKSVVDLAELKKNKVDFGEKVIFGPSSYRENTITIGPNQSLSDEEICASEDLHLAGVELNFKLTPDKNGTKWIELRKNENVRSILGA